MKNIVICIICLSICGVLGCDKKSIQTYSFVDIVDASLDEDKMFLIYLCNPETIRYKKMKAILSEKQVKQIINREFLFYEMDIRRDNFFNELMFSFETNLFLVLKGDSIVSLVRPSDSPSSFAKILQNHKSSSFPSLVNSVSLLQGANESVAFTVNKILRLQYQLRKEIISSKQFTAELVNTINRHPYFYNKYLLLKEGLTGDFGNEFKDYNLLDSLSFFEKSLYHRFVKYLQSSRYNIDTCLKGSVKFNFLMYDFGKVKNKQKVMCSFLFENIGDVPCLIYDIKPTCGCIIAKWSKRPVLTGVRDSILVEFIGNSPGYFEKQIRISDNSSLRNLCLRVKGEVIQ